MEPGLRSADQATRYLRSVVTSFPIQWIEEFRGRDILAVMKLLQTSIQDFRTSDQKLTRNLWKPFKANPPVPPPVTKVLAYCMHSQGLVPRYLLKRIREKDWGHLLVWVDGQTHPPPATESLEEWNSWAKARHESEVRDARLRKSQLTPLQRKFQQVIEAVEARDVTWQGIVWSMDVDLDQEPADIMAALELLGHNQGPGPVTPSPLLALPLQFGGQSTPATPRALVHQSSASGIGYATPHAAPHVLAQPQTGFKVSALSNPNDYQHNQTNLTPKGGRSLPSLQVQLGDIASTPLGGSGMVASGQSSSWGPNSPLPVGQQASRFPLRGVGASAVDWEQSNNGPIHLPPLQPSNPSTPSQPAQWTQVSYSPTSAPTEAQHPLAAGIEPNNAEPNQPSPRLRALAWLYELEETFREGFSTVKQQVSGLQTQMEGINQRLDRMAEMIDSRGVRSRDHENDDEPPRKKPRTGNTDNDDLKS